VAAGLASLPVKVEVRSIEQTPAERVSDFDLLVLGFPVYACDAPRLFFDYLERLEAGAGRGVFVFCTKGAFTGNALINVLTQMERRGYVSFGGTSVTMPGSDGLAFMRRESWMVRAALKKDYENLQKANTLTTRIRNTIRQQSEGCPAAQLRCAPKTRLAGMLLGWLVSALYRWLERRLRQRFWADDACTACGHCARICPTRNIRIEGLRPVFDDRCQLCMRCVHRCPEQAIQIGKHTVGKFRWQGPKGQVDPPQAGASLSQG
jgi:ferredoxin